MQRLVKTEKEFQNILIHLAHILNRQHLVYSSQHVKILRLTTTKQAKTKQTPAQKDS